ncbi:MAG TPA: ComF family protein [Candidatus Copromorpha excrementigallinarum]|uniref:ComF family protein n=1 Tax=Candidatus Allocopromorpha excrementigallinarum TaxID=2840742 RepID=A0A9D1I0I6_9FIRM|nr:ComF family protein [Candidatus Copromorpha excrementigallinarum]
MKKKFEKYMEALEEALFPSNIYCICCGSLIDGTRNYSLCDDCMKKLHWINGRSCGKCGKSLPDTYRGNICYDCLGQRHNFVRGYSCLTYGLYERKLLMDYKYGGKGYLSKKLGDILYDRISCEKLDIDVIIPVPIHRKRAASRGYDQSALMAERLSRLWGVPLERNSFVRIKNTPFLRSLGPAERQACMEGAFAPVKMKEDRVKGKKVLMVDDIYTTGATADAFAGALTKSGAAGVWLLTLASGGNRRPDNL